MMRRLTRFTALVAAAGVLAAWNGAFAQTATQADFDDCNRQAQASIGAGTSGSVSGTGAAGTLSSGGSTVTSPGSSDANRQPNASGRISGSPGSPGTDTGAVSSSPSVSGSAGAGGTSSSATGSPSASPRVGGATATTPSGSSGGDAQLRGMGAAGAGNAAYESAYRDCMKRRGF
jgi:hypothetical protein